MSKQSLRFLRVFSAQERDHYPLRVSLFRYDRLRVSIERYADCRVAQQLLHDLQLCAGRSKQRRIGVTKSMPADSLCDAQFSRSRNDVVPHLCRDIYRPTTRIRLQAFFNNIKACKHRQSGVRGNANPQPVGVWHVVGILRLLFYFGKSVGRNVVAGSCVRWGVFIPCPYGREVSNES